MRDYVITSNLKKPEFTKMIFVQGDTGVSIKINLIEDDNPVNMEGCSIVAVYKRSDNVIIPKRIIHIDNYSFTAILDSEITKVPGTLNMDFEITKPNNQVTTFMVSAEIRKKIAYDGAKPTIPDGTVYLDIPNKTLVISNGISIKDGTLTI